MVLGFPTWVSRGLKLNIDNRPCQNGLNNMIKILNLAMHGQVIQITYLDTNDILHLSRTVHVIYRP